MEMMESPAASAGGVYFLGTVALRAGLSQRVMLMVSAVKICAGRSCAIKSLSFCLWLNSRGTTPGEGANMTLGWVGAGCMRLLPTLIL